jgi:hypothetical protein
LLRHLVDEYDARPLGVARDSLVLTLARPPQAVPELRRAAWTRFLYGDPTLFEGAFGLRELARASRDQTWLCWWD